MKNNLKKWSVWLLVVCLMLGCAGNALAEEGTVPSDFGPMEPLMDLVAGAALVANEEPQPIAGSEGLLSPEFVSSFFSLGVNGNPVLGITEDFLADTAKQAEYLGKVFKAGAPELAQIQKADPINGYIGFRAVTVNTAAETGGIQIVGEVYWAPKPISMLTDAEYAEVEWQEPAIFTLEPDAAAMNGFRIAGFSQGTELKMEEVVQGYFDAILVEYVNTSLGFSVQYPSVFTDDLLMEHGNGFVATLPDGNVSVSAKRIDNVDNVDLATYVSAISEGIESSKVQINPEIQNATLTYTTAEGNIVFNVYVVTDQHIYQTELSYPKQLNGEYHMYTTYMQNSFIVDEVSVG